MLEINKHAGASSTLVYNENNINDHNGCCNNMDKVGCDDSCTVIVDGAGNNDSIIEMMLIIIVTWS